MQIHTVNIEIDNAEHCLSIIILPFKQSSFSICKHFQKHTIANKDYDHREYYSISIVIWPDRHQATMLQHKRS